MKEMFLCYGNIIFSVPNKLLGGIRCVTGCGPNFWHTALNKYIRPKLAIYSTS